MTVGWTANACRELRAIHDPHPGRSYGILSRSLAPLEQRVSVVEAGFKPASPQCLQPGPSPTGDDPSHPVLPESATIARFENRSKRSRLQTAAGHVASRV
jgi:hypothetical protein